MSHRDLQEDIGLELPFAGNMIAELLEYDSDVKPTRPYTLADNDQLSTGSLVRIGSRRYNS